MEVQCIPQTNVFPLAGDSHFSRWCCPWCGRRIARTRLQRGSHALRRTSTKGGSWVLFYIYIYHIIKQGESWYIVDIQSSIDFVNFVWNHRVKNHPQPPTFLRQSRLESHFDHIAPLIINHHYNVFIINHHYNVLIINHHYNLFIIHHHYNLFILNHHYNLLFINHHYICFNH